VVDEGTDGGYGKLTEGSNPSLNVERWSKPEFGAPTTIMFSESSLRYAMTTNQSYRSLNDRDFAQTECQPCCGMSQNPCESTQCVMMHYGLKLDVIVFWVA
jgi:hypothetical protein